MPAACFATPTFVSAASRLRRTGPAAPLLRYTVVNNAVVVVCSRSVVGSLPSTDKGRLLTDSRL